MKIAIAGLGTVAQSVIQLLQENQQLIESRIDQKYEIVGISARDQHKKRDINIDNFPWFSDPVAMINHTKPDMVLELIGGSDGIAYDICQAALEQNCHLVTANKALIATHGDTLLQLAKAKKLYFMYEAAVAGGIPIIKALKEGLSANKIDMIYGILNGTCNYILSSMEDTGKEFADVLQDAQEKGYAEADPSFDIDGVDAAHKLAILSSLAFDTLISFDTVYNEGIRYITAQDIQFAKELGYKIRLLAITEKVGDAVRQRVHPCMIPDDNPIARIAGARNAVIPVGNYVGSSIFEGWGAGGAPTASAVVADIIDIARHIHMKALPGYPEFIAATALDMDNLTTQYYVRLHVVDQPGVLANITSVLAQNDISIESFLQHGRQPEKSVTIIMKTHEVVEKNMKSALEQLSGIDTILKKPFMVRIEAPRTNQ